MTAAADRIRGEGAALGIETITKVIEGKRVPYRRVTCSCCPAHHERQYSPGAPPAQVRQNFEAAGWKWLGRDIWKCPGCASKRPEKPVTTHTEPKKEMTMPPTPISDSPREPTQKDKKRIRDFLDGNFDEDKGEYLDGQSDQSGADQLKVPRAWVTKLREDAYGPIKADPELATLRADLEKLRVAYALTANDFQALSGKFDREIAALSVRIAAAEKRVGIAA